MFISTQNFEWRGRNAQGEIEQGTRQSKNKQEVQQWLQQRGVIPIAIIKLKKHSTLFSGRVTKQELAVMSRQIATTLSAGLDVVMAIQLVLQGASNKLLQQTLNTILIDIRAGNSLAVSLRRYPQYFDTIYCDLVATGEQSGTLDVIFQRLASFQEKSQSLKSKMKKAMYYPVVVLIVSVAVTAVLLGFVIPRFKGIYDAMNAELPEFTLAVLSASEWFQEYGLWTILATGLLCFVLINRINQSPKFASRASRLCLALPVFGGLVHKASTVRFCRTLSTTFAAGTPLIEALNAAALACGNLVYKQAIFDAKEHVLNGRTLYYGLSANPIFSDLTLQMIKVGEDTGSLEYMLDKVADIHEGEMDDTIDGLSSMIEPLIISVLAIIIGSLVIAMYLPVFNMGGLF